MVAEIFWKSFSQLYSAFFFLLLGNLNMDSGISVTLSLSSALIRFLTLIESGSHLHKIVRRGSILMFPCLFCDYHDFLQVWKLENTLSQLRVQHRESRAIHDFKRTTRDLSIHMNAAGFFDIRRPILVAVRRVSLLHQLLKHASGIRAVVYFSSPTLC